MDSTQDTPPAAAGIKAGDAPPPADAAPEAVEEADGDLLRRACAGDQAAWHALYTRFTPEIHLRAARLFRKHGPRLHENASRMFIEDLVQSVWTHLLAHREAVASGYDESKGSLEDYLMGTAHNHIISWFRAKANQRLPIGSKFERVQGIEAREPSPEIRVADQEELMSLRKCMESCMESRDVDLLIRALVNDEAVADIASEQGVSRNALDQRISRARKRLQDCMSRLGLSRSSLDK